jgi:D-3-phosphoglycerate dehydrogenase
VSNKKKILVVQKIHDEGIKLIENNPDFEFDLIDVEEMVETIDPILFKKKVSDCDAISIRTEKLPGEIIESANKLKVISRHGVGYDNIDLLATKKKNVTLTITAKANAIAVAEHVLFMLLSISKGKNMYDDAVKSGNFGDRNKLPKTIELWNKNILIAGFGRIGQCLIKRCKGFEMNVFVYDPFVSKDVIEKFGGVKVDNLAEAVKQMDAISLHVPLNEETKNLINFDLLKTMKKNCIIINAARGGIVNEEDLNKALEKNLIYGAGLDVFETEPPKANNRLLKNNKVFLSPHTAAFTEECMIRMGKETIQNIFDFFDQKLEKSKIIKL